MPLKGASITLYDQDGADSSTDVDSSDEVTLISHKPLPLLHKPLPLLPKPNQFEEHAQHQKSSYPTATRHPHLSQPKILAASSLKPTPSTYTPHPSQSSSPSGSPSLPSAYLASLAELHYILPDGLSSQNTALTALSPPPRHRARQGGKVLYEPMDHTLCPIHHSTQPCWSCDKARNRDTNEKLRFPF